jgi:hypothetical protein
MRAWLALALLGALLAPGVSLADWSKSQDGANNCSSLTPGNRCFYDFSDTTDPAVLDTLECTNGINYWFDPDEDGPNVGALVQPYRCSERSLSTNHCTPIYNDTDGDGIPDALPLDGTTVLRIGREHVLTGFLGFDVTANPNLDDARITVECY